MILTLSQTVQRAKNGDREAYGELYAYYYKELYRYAYYCLRHEQDAEDVVAETVACAFAQLKQLKKDEAFPMWLFSILSNQVRRRKKAYVKEHQNLPLEDMETLADEYTPQSEERIDLYRALSQLPEKERSIVLLAVVDGFTGNEIAQILKMKPSTVRSKLSRTLKRLQQSLSEAEQIQKGAAQ